MLLVHSALSRKRLKRASRDTIGERRIPAFRDLRLGQAADEESDVVDLAEEGGVVLADAAGGRATSSDRHTCPRFCSGVSVVFHSRSLYESFGKLLTLRPSM